MKRETQFLRQGWLLLIAGLGLVSSETLAEPMRVICRTRDLKLGYADIGATNFTPFKTQEPVAHFSIAPTMDRLLYVVVADGEDAGKRTYYNIHFPLFVADLEGGSPKKLTDAVGDANVVYVASMERRAEEMFSQCGGPLYPHWSADGEKILFMGWREKEGKQIGSFPVQMINVADGTIKEIARIPGPTPMLAGSTAPWEKTVTDSPYATYWLQRVPFLSADGIPDSLMLQLAKPKMPRGGGSLFSTDPATGLPVADPAHMARQLGIAGSTNALIWYASDLRWHPAGDALTWTSNTKTNTRALYVRPLSALTSPSVGRQTNLVANLQFGDEFLWAPDGDQVALVYKYGGGKQGIGHQVLLAKRQTGELRLLHDDKPHPTVSRVRAMAWSADSSKLAVYVNAEDHPSRYLIFEVTKPGSPPIVIPNAHIIEPKLSLASRQLSAFGPDNETFYFIGFGRNGNRITPTRDLVAVALPTNNVSVISTQMMTRIPVVPKGQYVDAFEFVMPVTQWCTPLEIVIPTGGSDWIHDNVPANSQVRDRLLDGVLGLPDIKADHKRLSQQLDRLRKDLGRTLEAKKLKEHERLAAKLREVETKYLQAISPVMMAFTDAEETRLVRSLYEHAECLIDRAQEALDDARAYNYTTSWSEFNRRKQLYDIIQADLSHTLNQFQAINALRLSRVQRRLSEARTPFARRGQLDLPAAAAALRPIQRHLRDVYLDMGWVAVELNHCHTEELFLNQDSYFAGFWATHQQAENIEEGETLKEESAQCILFSMKYMRVGHLEAFMGGVDVMKRFFNWMGSFVTDADLLHTVSDEVTENLREAREKHEQARQTLEQIRGYTDEQTRQILSRTDQGLLRLEQNRLYHEQTSGGLRRLAACYRIDVREQMDAELQIARDHAALVARDMDPALNARIGANAEGMFGRLKRFFIDPIGMVRVAMEDTRWGGDHYTAPILHVGKRKDQVKQITELRTALEKVNFSPFRLQKQLPASYQVYLELERDNPDFLQWTLTRERLAAQWRMDACDRQIELAETPDEIFWLQQLKDRNRAFLMMEVADKQPWLWRLQGADKLMVWDYDGALECFYLAAEAMGADVTDRLRKRRRAAAEQGTPQAELPTSTEADREAYRQAQQMLAQVDELRDAIRWRKTIDVGIDELTQMGNVAVQTSLFELLGQGVGRALPALRGGVAAEAEAIAGAAATAEAAAGAETWGAWVWRKLNQPWRGSKWFWDPLWHQFNPYADVMNAALIKREWQAIAFSSARLGMLHGIQVVQQNMIKRGIAMGYFGLDEQWADFFANALVSSAQARRPNGNTVLWDTAVWLRDLNARFAFEVMDCGLWKNRQTARRILAEEHQFFRWCQEFKEAVRRGNPEEIAAAHHEGELYLVPISKEWLQARYEEMFPTDGPKPGTPERLAQIGKFFKGLNWERDIMKAGLKKADPLNRNIDNLRRELIASAQTRFFQEPGFKKYVDYVVSYLYIGSAGMKWSKAYKLCDSDIDFTLLLREDTPESIRNQIRQDFLVYFQKFAQGTELEGFEMSMMVDLMPRFYRTGESADGLTAMIVNEPNLDRRAANRDAMRDGIKKTIDQLIKNASDKERYLDRGNLIMLNLFTRIGYFLKQATMKTSEDGVELVDEPTARFDELYRDIPFEPWMAFDCVIGNLGFIYQHTYKHPNDRVWYQNVLAGKYAIRGALYSMLLLSKKGRDRLNSLTRAECEAKGWDGAERVVVEVARELLGEPSAVKELGLPTRLRDRNGKMMNMTAEKWTQLFDQWSARKEGLPDEQVVARPDDTTQLKAENPEVSRRLEDSIAMTEGAFEAILRKAIVTQATELKKLGNAAKDARARGDDGAADIFELKMKQIILSQAGVWNRMDPKHQNLVLREMPPEADAWLAIAAVEKLNRSGTTPAPTPTCPHRIVLEPGALRVLDPYIVTEESVEDRVRLIKGLQQRAAANPQTKLFLTRALYDDAEPPPADRAVAPADLMRATDEAATARVRADTDLDRTASLPARDTATTNTRPAPAPAILPPPVAASPPTTPPAQSGINVSGLLAQAQQLYSQNRLQEARQLYQAAAQMNPQSADAQIGLGRICNYTAQLNDAATAYERAFQLAPTTPNIRTWIAEIRLHQGDYAAASKWIAEELRANPRSGWAMSLRGSVLLATGDARGAQAAFQQAMKLDANTARNRYQNAQSLDQSGQTGRAATEFVAAVYLNPPVAAPYYAVANCYAKMGQGQLAVQWYERYLKLDSTSQWATQARQEIRRLRGR